MSDERSSLTNRIASPEEAARESRHEVLRELLTDLHRRLRPTTTTEPLFAGVSDAWPAAR